MKEVAFRLDNGIPVNQRIDDRIFPVSAFFTMAMVKASPPGASFLAFGNSSDLGNLLMSFYESDQREGGHFAAMLEMVAAEICRRKESRDPWPGAGDGVSH